MRKGIREITRMKFDERMFAFLGLLLGGFVCTQANTQKFIGRGNNFEKGKLIALANLMQNLRNGRKKKCFKAIGQKAPPPSLLICLCVYDEKSGALKFNIMIYDH